ncbi:MAG: hypothetical protein GY870_00685 [archaeon]|nr:hypothetical protein [archaeon]
MNSESENTKINNKKRTLKDRKIVLTSEFDSGNAINFERFDEGIYSFMPERDPGKNYSGQAYYFKFSVENLTKLPIKITVTAIADYDDTWRGFSPALKSLFWRYTSQGGMIHLDSSCVKSSPKTIALNLSLLPNEKMKISNMLTVPYSEMVDIIHDIDQIQYPTFVKMTVIGKSVQNNSIYSIKINPIEEHWNNESKFRIIISGSPQSNEFGDFAAILLLERFLKEGAEFWDDFHRYFRLEFILFQNPDGIKLGKNMVNSKGENIFFGFTEEDEKMSQENQIVWNYLKNNVPDLYLEFHSFFQDYKTLRPYLYPLDFFKSKIKQNLYKKISKTLKSYCNGGKEEIKVEQKYFCDTLAYKLQKKYETYAIQFKLHSCMDLNDTEDVIWKVFSKSIKVLRKSGKSI